MKINLLNDRYALIDDEDWPIVKSYKWYADVRQTGHVYVKARIGKHRTIYLHRVVLNAQRGHHVDHINGNGLDNRRANLRLCSPSQNLGNQRVSRSGYKTSRYKGVYWDNYYECWKFRVYLHGRPFKSGSCNTELEAALAYNEWALRAFGEFAQPNIIRKCVSCANAT